MTPSYSPQTLYYPPAPWTLKGKAVQSLQLVDLEKVRSHIPPELEIVQPFPGKTFAGLYLAAYESGSDLEYHELIVVSGLVRYVNRTGIWVSHIYVDNLHSVAGGREVWGLPKQMAEFDWTEGQHPEVVVSQNQQVLCRLRYGWQIPGLRQPIPFIGAFSTLGSELVWFSGEGAVYPHLLLGAHLQVPNTSPIASLGLDQPWMVFYLRDLDLKIEPPTVEGTTRGRPPA